MSYTSIIKKFDFAAAHRLFTTVPKNHPCNNLHGHNYECDLEIKTKLNREMIIDFSELKKIINNVVSRFDHKTILNSSDFLVNVLTNNSNQKIFLLAGDPTVENMTFCMSHLLIHELVPNMVFSTVESLTLHMSETMNSIGTYTWNRGDKLSKILGRSLSIDEDVICYL
jgi:6-pyruvoyl tetrahydropterin synthase/QueD family protein